MDLMTTAQAAPLLGVSRWTVRRMAKDGRLPAIQTNMGVLITRQAIDAYLAGR